MPEPEARRRRGAGRERRAGDSESRSTHKLGTQREEGESRSTHELGTQREEGDRATWPHKGTTSGRPPARRGDQETPRSVEGALTGRRVPKTPAPEAETGTQGPEGCGAGSSGLRGMDFQVGATKTFGKQVVAVVTRHRE